MFAQKSHQLTLLRAGGHYIFSASKGIIGTRNFAAKVCAIRGHPKLTEKQGRVIPLGYSQTHKKM